MSSKIFSLDFAVAFILFFAVHETFAAYPTSKLNGVVGFAAQAGITGGWGGQVVEVDSVEKLMKNVAGSTPLVVVITCDIKTTARTVIYMGSNKTILGSFKKPTLHNIYLLTGGNSGNIILQNLVFEHSPDLIDNNYKQVVISSGSKYWIDHCSFVGHPSWVHGDASEDKLLQIKDYADYATISNSYFGNHKKGCIFGKAEDGHREFDGYPHLTICNNHYENMDIRAPGLMRYGFYHVFNNYLNKVNHAFTIHDSCQVYSENNYFEDDKNILDDYSNGYFTDVGSYTSNSVMKQTSSKDSWKPPYKYSIKLPAAAKNFALVHAGAQTSELIFPL